MQDLETNNREIALESLRISIARWDDKCVFEAAIPGLLLYRYVEPTQRLSLISCTL
jgi:hypothetical protein